MAKGQKRSNREPKKPKQKKAPPKAESPFANLAKSSGSAEAARGKAKT